MVFDTRGKRKHVIRVVYAILAILMGASLFLVVGPVNIGSLIGNSSSTGNAAGVLHEQAERIEKRLAQNPDDEQLLLALTRARISAGNAQLEGLETAAPTVPESAHADYEAAEQSWNRYLKQAGGEPNASVAQLVAATFFRLAESGSRSVTEIQSNVTSAKTAQQIVADQQPNVGSLSSLAIYDYFDGDFAAGDEATKQAAARAPAKTEAKEIEKQLAEYRKRAKKFVTQLERFSKAQKEARKEQLQNPLGGLGGG
jgi:hypothetical protein